MIAFYFLLQAAVSVGVLLVMSSLSSAWQPGKHDLFDFQSVHHQPGRQAILVMLTLVLASVPTLLLVRRKWPALWPLATPPGLGLTRPGHPLFYVLALVIGLAVPILGGWLTEWLAHGQPVTQDIAQIGTNTPLALRLPLALIVVSLGPLVEELLFRGVLLSALLKYGRMPLAVLLSSLVFALVHLPGLGWHWFALPDLLILAVALAWLRLQSASLWPGVLAHGANNALAMVAWFVTINPPG